MGGRAPRSRAATRPRAPACARRGGGLCLSRSDSNSDIKNRKDSNSMNTAIFHTKNYQTKNL